MNPADDIAYEGWNPCLIWHKKTIRSNYWCVHGHVLSPFIRLVTNGHEYNRRKVITFYLTRLIIIDTP